jgi:hypothetical protein
MHSQTGLHRSIMPVQECARAGENALQQPTHASISAVAVSFARL